MEKKHDLTEGVICKKLLFFLLSIFYGNLFQQFYTKENVFVRHFCKVIVSFLITLIGITFLSFCLSYLSPSDPAAQWLTEQGMPVSAQTLERTREEMGLNRPMIVQYADWLWGLLRFDMGTSLRLRRPVAQLLLGALPNTLYLTLGSILLVTIISLPMGVMCARREGTLFDMVVQVITYVLASFPLFFFALITIYLLAFRLKIFPVLGAAGFTGIVMPVLVMSITFSGWFVRQVRAIILHEMQRDYVLGLRSRGIPEGDIFRKHILRNALVPVITLIGMSFGSLLGGSIILESIFSWRGIGRLELEAIGYRDYPLIQGYIVWTTVMYLFINFIVEMLYGLLDPRVKRGKI